MSFKGFSLPFVLMTLLWGCSKSEKKADMADNQNPLKKALPSIQKKRPEVTKKFYAANYSDDEKWLKGIDTKQKNVFFFIIPKSSLTPLKVNCRLQFASAGEAEVQTVYRTEQSDRSSIFVRVNKNLDPDKDGFPNPIFLKSLAIVASGFSKEYKWRNGISLEKPGLIVFSIRENELVPVKPGDRLKFPKSGEAIVKEVVEYKVDDRKFNILVTVDTILDPDEDGFPNPVYVMFTM